MLMMVLLLVTPTANHISSKTSWCYLHVPWVHCLFDRATTDDRISVLFCMVRTGVPLKWVRDRGWTKENIIPKATPWPELKHNERLLKVQVKNAEMSLIRDPGNQDAINERKKRYGEQRSNQKSQSGQIAFMDHVLSNMAGGDEHVSAFVEEYITRSKLIKARVPVLLDAVSKERLLEESRRALLHFKKWGEGQSEIDRKAIHTVLAILLRSGIDHKEIESAGIKGYGFNTLGMHTISIHNILEYHVVRSLVTMT